MKPVTSNYLIKNLIRFLYENGLKNLLPWTRINTEQTNIIGWRFDGVPGAVLFSFPVGPDEIPSTLLHAVQSTLIVGESSHIQDSLILPFTDSIGSSITREGPYILLDFVVPIPVTYLSDGNFKNVAIEQADHIWKPIKGLVSQLRIWKSQMTPDDKEVIL